MQERHEPKIEDRG